VTHPCGTPDGHLAKEKPLTFVDQRLYLFWW